MVFGVCNDLLHRPPRLRRRLPGRLPDSGSKVHSIRDPDLLGNWLYGVAAAHRPVCQGAVASAATRKPPRCWTQSQTSPTRPPSNRSWPASRPNCCTKKSSACHERSVCQSSCATSRGSRSTRRPGGCVAHTGQFAAGWPGAREKLGAADPPRRHLTRRHTRRGPFHAFLPRRRCHPTCIETTARVAIQFAAGQSAAPLATAVARQLLRSMLFHKGKLLVAVVPVARRPRHERRLPDTGPGEERRAQAVPARNSNGASINKTNSVSWPGRRSDHHSWPRAHPRWQAGLRRSGRRRGHAPTATANPPLEGTRTLRSPGLGDRRCGWPLPRRLHEPHG